MTQDTKVESGTGYQMALVMLLSANFGIVFFDRNAMSFLMPFIKPDLALSNTQVGMLAGALSFTWAAAAFAIGMISGKSGSRKVPLVIATVGFSLCSVLSGFAASFAALLGARLLMGVAAGALCRSASQSLPRRLNPGTEVWRWV